MAPIGLIMSIELTEQDRQELLDLARASIRHGLLQSTPEPVQLKDYPMHLQERLASFVTLHLHGQLRGCIGSLEAHRPLVEDIAQNAYAAAFSDPRFAPLTQREYVDLEIHISILNPAEEMAFDTEQELIRQLRPGIDGLILKDGLMRGTFLPSVWQQLPEPRIFLHHLKLKAGLAADYWSDTLRCYRYTTISFP